MRRTVARLAVSHIRYLADRSDRERYIAGDGYNENKAQGVHPKSEALDLLMVCCICTALYIVIVVRLGNTVINTVIVSYHCDTDGKSYQE
jgi:hypothetical protein